jgi:hypothetical protein
MDVSTLSFVLPVIVLLLLASAPRGGKMPLVKLPEHHNEMERRMDIISLSSMWVIAFALIYAALVDLAIYTSGSKALTVSDHISTILSKYPVFGVLAGMVVGHLAWGQRPTTPPQ